MPPHELSGLDALLTRMEAIAKAVNAFTSEAVQHEAFSALIAAFEGKRHDGQRQVAAVPSSQQPLTGDAPEEPTRREGRIVKSARAKRASSGSRSEWKMVKDLDLNPQAKQSFADFINERKPRSNEDKYPVIVYYLSEVLGIEEISIGHIGTVFRLMKEWKEPTNLVGGLGVASSRKGTLDTSSYEDIKLTPAGRNFVEHDLPPKLKAK